MSDKTAVEHANVVVVGGGNAGYSAALAAAERGRSVVLLEKGDADHSGGNSFYTAGATRISHNGLEELKDLLQPDPRHSRTVVPPYPADEFIADMNKVTLGKNDPELTRVMATESQDTVRWLASHGFQYRLMYERQAYARPDGSYLFWGGLAVGNVGGGQGLMADHARAAGALGVRSRLGSRATELIYESGSVTGVKYSTEDGGQKTIMAESVILAAGGFQANPELVAEHLGARWKNAKIRGTRNNTGEMILEGLRMGAQRGGDWSSCHSVAWDALHPKNQSNRELTNQLTRGGYPLGIVVNKHGERFIDEGSDFRNHTYAKYGRDVLDQPGSIAFQLFDATTRPMLRAEEYEMPGVSVVVADSIEQLARIAGIDAAKLVATVTEFNRSIDRSREFDPNVKDGRMAHVTPPKSNWSNPLDTGPFYAFPVTCAITFTFGGLKADTFGRVLSTDGGPIPGLLAAGEMLGGLFSNNYPGGSGLTAGAVFGKRAGTVA